MPGTTNTASDFALVERIRRRDRDALGALYDRYCAMVLGIIRRIVNDDELADEVLQQTFLEAWRTVDSYDDAKLAVSTWLMCLARSCALEKTRSRGLRATADGGSMDGMLVQLEPQQRRVIELFYYQGSTIEQAASELAMTPDNCSAQLRTAISQLRSLCTEGTQQE